MRLLSGILAGQSFDSELTGDTSLSRRPMRRVSEPLARLGAAITTSEDGTPPVKITGGQPLSGCRISIKITCFVDLVESEEDAERKTCARFIEIASSL